MCLECGYYNGRQVMDLATEKAKREARIKAKEERIKNELGSASPAPVSDAVAEVKETKKKTAK